MDLQIRISEDPRRLVQVVLVELVIWLASSKISWTHTTWVCLGSQPSPSRMACPSKWWTSRNSSSSMAHKACIITTGICRQPHFCQDPCSRARRHRAQAAATSQLATKASPQAAKCCFSNLHIQTNSDVTLTLSPQTHSLFLSRSNSIKLPLNLIQNFLVTSFLLVFLVDCKFERLNCFLLCPHHVWLEWN